MPASYTITLSAEAVAVLIALLEQSFTGASGGPDIGSSLYREDLLDQLRGVVWSGRGGHDDAVETAHPSEPEPQASCPTL